MNRTDTDMKKRWICLFVENQTGTLARISGLFSGKCYNIDSLTVGETEDPTISRMTITLTSDEKTFEQIKKQLNRSVEVIKVVDYTDLPLQSKELMFVKINHCTAGDKEEAFRIAGVFGVRVVDYDKRRVLLECVQTEKKNNTLIGLLQQNFPNRIEVARGGSVAVEAITINDR